MKKLSEYQDTEAIVLLTKLAAPVIAIMGDKKVVATFSKKGRFEALKKAKEEGGEDVSALFVEYLMIPITEAIESHARDVFRILAVLEGVPAEEYHCTPVTAIQTIVEALQDEDLQSFFLSHLPKDSSGDSGLQSENTEVAAE